MNPLSVESPSLFPASSAAALYNATSMLLSRLDVLASQRSTSAQPSGKSCPNSAAVVSLKSGATNTSDQRAEATVVGAQPDLSPRCISPDLWLTIVSHNSIRPIKVLR